MCTIVVLYYSEILRGDIFLIRPNLSAFALLKMEIPRKYRIQKSRSIFSCLAHKKLRQTELVTKMQEAACKYDNIIMELR